MSETFRLNGQNPCLGTEFSPAGGKFREIRQYCHSLSAKFFGGWGLSSKKAPASPVVSRRLPSRPRRVPVVSRRIPVVSHRQSGQTSPIEANGCPALTVKVAKVAPKEHPTLPGFIMQRGFSRILPPILLPAAKVSVIASCV